MGWPVVLKRVLFSPIQNYAWSMLKDHGEHDQYSPFNTFPAYFIFVVTKSLNPNFLRLYSLNKRLRNFM